MLKFLSISAMVIMAFAVLPSCLEAADVSGTYECKDGKDVATCVVSQNKDGQIFLEGNFASSDNLRSCTYTATCMVKENWLICLNGDDADMAQEEQGSDILERRLEMKIMDDALELTYFKTSMCMGVGLPDGIYKRIPVSKNMKSGNATDKNTPSIFIGTPKAQKEMGKLFWQISDRSEENMLVAGSPDNLTKANPRLAACIKDALVNGQQVRIAGNWGRAEGVNTLDPATATCEPIKSSADCPHKVIATRTIEGIYDGVECGDGCYLTLKLGKDKYLSMFADEDEVSNLFGEKRGKKVSVTYTLEQMWMPEDVDDESPNAPGWCQIAEVFKSGKVLGK